MLPNNAKKTIREDSKWTWGDSNPGPPQCDGGEDKKIQDHKFQGSTSQAEIRPIKDKKHNCESGNNKCISPESQHQRWEQIRMGY